MNWDFGDILLTMMVFFFWVIYIWMFIAVFGDIFRRRNLSGVAKAGWILLICVLPFLGILLYMITRPPPTDDEIRDAMNAGGYVASPADELTKLSKLKDEGKISAAEFEQLKVRVIA